MNQRLEVILSVIIYSVTSGTMLLLNKLAVHHLPYPSLVSSFQIASTLVMIYGAKMFGLIEVDKVEWKYVVPYLFYVSMFCFGILCNMHSLEISNVETVIVFRSLTPIGVALLDFIFLGRELPGPRSWASLLLIGFGAYMYATYDEKFQTQGWTAYLWPIAYFFVICTEMCLGKKIISSVDLKTISGPVAYTNLLGLLPMIAFGWLGNEFNRFSEDRAEGKPITTAAIIFLILSSFAGTAIGYAGWWCRDKVSATSYTLVGVLNKCLTILLNLVIWDKHAAPGGIIALLVCLAGGSIYRQSPMRKGTEKVVPASPDVELASSGDSETEKLMANGNDDIVKRRQGD